MLERGTATKLRLPATNGRHTTARRHRDIMPKQLLAAALRARSAEIRGRLSALDELVEALQTTGEVSSFREAAMRLVPRWHFAMLNDGERNDAFATAIEKQIRPGMHVLDIGSGTGLLAMLAARAGASKVTSCEADPIMAEIARIVVAEHGLDDVITVVGGMSTTLSAPRDIPPADLIVSEIVDCGLIGEGILPTIRHARKHLLAPGGRLLPERARIIGAALESSAVVRLNKVTTVAGFNVEALNQLSTEGHFPVRLHTWPHRFLSEPIEVVGFDFATGSLEDGEVALRVQSNADGTAHGFVLWFEMDLGSSVVLRNSPDNVGSHWMQAFVEFPQHLIVRKGQSFDVNVRWHNGRLHASTH